MCQTKFSVLFCSFCFVFACCLQALTGYFDTNSQSQKDIFSIVKNKINLCRAPMAPRTRSHRKQCLLGAVWAGCTLEVLFRFQSMVVRVRRLAALRAVVSRSVRFFFIFLTMPRGKMSFRCQSILTFPHKTRLQARAGSKQNLAKVWQVLFIFLTWILKPSISCAFLFICFCRQKRFLVKIHFSLNMLSQFEGKDLMLHTGTV